MIYRTTTNRYLATPADLSYAATPTGIDMTRITTADIARSSIAPSEELAYAVEAAESIMASFPSKASRNTSLARIKQQLIDATRVATELPDAATLPAAVNAVANNHIWQTNNRRVYVSPKQLSYAHLYSNPDAIRPNQIQAEDLECSIDVHSCDLAKALILYTQNRSLETVRTENDKVLIRNGNEYEAFESILNRASKMELLMHLSKVQLQLEAHQFRVHMAATSNP